MKKKVMFKGKLFLYWRIWVCSFVMFILGGTIQSMFDWWRFMVICMGLAVASLLFVTFSLEKNYEEKKKEEKLSNYTGPRNTEEY